MWKAAEASQDVVFAGGPSEQSPPVGTLRHEQFSVLPDISTQALFMLQGSGSGSLATLQSYFYFSFCAKPFAQPPSFTSFSIADVLYLL
jgi:hypothetical protein